MPNTDTTDTMQTITLRVSNEIYEAIQAAALLRGETMSALGRRYLTEGISREAEDIEEQMAAEFARRKAAVGKITAAAGSATTSAPDSD